MAPTPQDVINSWIDAAVCQKSPRGMYDGFTPYKADNNQPVIVKAFRQLGCQVTSLHAAGEGVYDLLVSYGWLVASVEIKNPDKSPSARKFTPAQVKWGTAWRGLRYVALTVDDVASIVAEMKRIFSHASQIATHPAGCQQEQYRAGVTG